jgi:uncharacterized membrane protein YebE (DUF533 family)
MFDTRDLLGAMLGTGMGGRNPRMGSLDGGGLGGMLGGGMGGLGGGLSGGGMLGGLAGRRMGGGGLQGALLGVLGGIAANALQRRLQGSPSTSSASWQPAADQSSTSRPTSDVARPDATGRLQESSVAGNAAVGELDEGRASLLVRVMVAAANADMRIDEQERTRILGKIEEAGADPSARAFVEQEMRAPMTLDEIAREVSGPDVAAQAYAAALAAIDVDKATERRFLATLAERTGLDAEIVNEIHDQLGQPRPG